MTREPVVDPLVGGHRVEVAHELRVANRVAGDVAPDVRPDAVLALLAEQVADDLVAVQRDGAGRVLALVLHLRDEVRAPRQERLSREMGCVSLGQHGGRAVHVLVGEGDDVHGP